MPLATYSFGAESPLKFVIPDKLATLYNEALVEFFRAQTRFNQKYGRQWDPREDPIAPRWTKKHVRAWNEFGDVMKEVLAKDGPFHENDIMEDFLVRNTAVSVVTAVGNGWGRAVTLFVFAGALYGYLKK